MHVPSIFAGNGTFLVVAGALQLLQIGIDGSTFGNLAPPGTFTFYVSVDYDYRYRRLLIVIK